jgi:acyl-CoA thioesterase
MGDFAFDEDSRVVAAASEAAFGGDSADAATGAFTRAFTGAFTGASAGVFAAELTGRWNGTAGAVNGGYMLAVCVRALAAGMPFPDPIVVSGFFLRPGTAGPATVRASVIRSGRTTAFGDSVLIQDGKEVVRATAAFARLGAVPGSGTDAVPGSGTDAVPGSGTDAGQDGLVFLDGTPPALPPPEECAGVPVGSFGLATIAERIEFRSAELPGWFLGQPSGRPASEFWMRFADGREADLLSLLLLVDSTAPSVLELGAASTTIQLTVHLRAHPAPGWLACRATTRFVSSGYHEEDFEVWDSAGTLVAQSRQLALILPR